MAGSLPPEFQEPLAAGHQILAGATCEIRFRRGQPLTMAAPGRQLYWQKGRWQEAPFWGDWEETGEGLTADVLERLWQQLTGGSQYRLETELKNGYLTLAGGHRLGFCGRAVTEGGSIKSMRDISYLTFGWPGRSKAPGLLSALAFAGRQLVLLPFCQSPFRRQNHTFKGTGSAGLPGHISARSCLPAPGGSRLAFQRSAGGRS